MYLELPTAHTTTSCDPNVVAAYLSCCILLTQANWGNSGCFTYPSACCSGAGSSWGGLCSCWGLRGGLGEKRRERRREGEELKDGSGTVVQVHMHSNIISRMHAWVTAHGHVPATLVITLTLLAAGRLWAIKHGGEEKGKGGRGGRGERGRESREVMGEDRMVYHVDKGKAMMHTYNTMIRQQIILLSLICTWSSLLPTL